VHEVARHLALRPRPAAETIEAVPAMLAVGCSSSGCWTLACPATSLIRPCGEEAMTTTDRRLRPELIAIIEDGAYSIPPETWATYFEDVEARLHPLDEPSPAEVRAAVRAAISRVRDDVNE
jgi:crotonobetainyl-CoA:carnitine CoA-transferase CaiB-like acyl-CoA transferase